MLARGVVLGCLAIALSVAHARGAGPIRTTIAIRPPAAVALGDHPEVVVDVRVTGGGPLRGAPVELSIDGVLYRRHSTDGSGASSFTLPNDLAAGDHRISAFYPGLSTTYLAASTTATLVVNPFELTIETVPSLPGMPFTLDGERFVAGDDGVARTTVSAVGEHVLVALPEEYQPGALRAEFSRWSAGNEFRPQLTISVPNVGPLQAGFDVFRPMSQSFIDLSGAAIDPGRITSITLRSSLGEVLTYPDGQSRFFKASRTVHRSSGLEPVDVRYNVTDVEVDGSNVVNAGQQQLYVTPDAVWRITLLLYSARVQPKDAFFGFTAGSSIEVIYPSGKTEVVPAGPDGVVVVEGLARGIYRMTVADAPGWAPAMPVALSRDQQVELRVVSWVDMAAAALVGFVVLFGLLIRGRPHLIGSTSRPVGEVTAEPGIPWPAGSPLALARAEIEVAPPEPIEPQLAEAEPVSLTTGRMRPLLASLPVESTLEGAASRRVGVSERRRGEDQRVFGSSALLASPLRGYDLGATARATAPRAPATLHRRLTSAGNGRVLKVLSTVPVRPVNVVDPALRIPTTRAAIRHDPAPTVPRVESAHPATSEPVCEACGSRLWGGALYCEECGRRVREPRRVSIGSPAREAGPRGSPA
jgi:hypothetical protein